MRIAIAGAGAIGRSIANALLDKKHKVLLIERSRQSYRPRRVPDADWMLADACEIDTLEKAGIDTCDAVMAATGDDETNLVFALLAKQNSVSGAWSLVSTTPTTSGCSARRGVSTLPVSTPRAIAAGVDEAASVDDIVRLITLRHAQAQIVEITLPPDTPLADTSIGALPLPPESFILLLLRGHRLLPAGSDTRLQAGDRLLVAAAGPLHPAIRQAFGQLQ